MFSPEGIEKTPEDATADPPYRSGSGQALGRLRAGGRSDRCVALDDGSLTNRFQTRAGVAQLVEQLICNQQVGGSNPSASLLWLNHLRGWATFL